MILKTRLREILNERGMTQKELANLSQLRENTISDLAKNNRDSINREHIGKVAKALNITDPGELFYFEKIESTILK